MLGACMFRIFMSSWWIVPLRIMKYPSVFLFMAFVFKSILSNISISTPIYCFFLSICLEYFSNPLLSVCIGLLSWGGSLVGSICAGHAFLFIQLPYVFWLKHLIHLYLRLLLIGTYSLPFHSLCTCVPLSLTLFLPLLKAVALHILQCWFGGGVFFQPSFPWETPYFTFHFNWEPCWLE